MSDGRNLALDGVRGLAALSVALGHCLLIVAGMEVWSKTVLDTEPGSIHGETIRAGTRTP